MERHWIAGIVGKPPGRGDSSSRVKLLSGALEQLADRVEGSLVLAAVATPGMVDLLLPVVRDSSLPLHLIAPWEQGQDDGNAPSSLSEQFSSAVSVSVQPGRGNTPEDWEDCELWLRSVADVLIVPESVGEAPDEAGDTKESAPVFPTIRFNEESGEIEFLGFPGEGRLTDPEFDQILADVTGNPDELSSLDACKKQASASARQNAPRARFYESASLLLNLSPSLIFGIGAAFQLGPRWLNLWSFAAALAAAIVALILSRLSSRRTWLSSRGVAEICRSQLATRGILDPLFPPSAAHLPGFTTLAQSLALFDRGKTAGEEGFPDITTRRDRYLEDRVDGQIRYYRDNGRTAERQERWIKRGFYIFTVLAFFANLGAVLFYMNSLPGVSTEINDQWISGFAAWVFPSLAAAAMGFLAIHEASRRSFAYAELARELESRKNMLRQLKSESSITEAVRGIEDRLLEEVGEWFRGRMF